MDPAQLHRLREQATAQTARILSRATAIRERIGAARKSDLADLDAAAAALHEGIEEQRRLRRDRAVAGAERERAEARAALERTVSELAPGTAGSDLRTIDADAVGRPSRWTRIGAFRAPDELGGAPALAPLICASHWRGRAARRICCSCSARGPGRSRGPTAEDRRSLPRGPGRLWHEPVAGSADTVPSARAGASVAMCLPRPLRGCGRTRPRIGVGNGSLG